MRFFTGLCAAMLLSTSAAHASAPANNNACSALPDHAALVQALRSAKSVGNGGMGNDMWGTLVARDGTVCAVGYTGAAVDAQWPGSRVISAQKANTANAFSLKGASLSTANLYAGSQPGGFLFGIENSNPVNTTVAYAGPATSYGSPSDPMVGKMIGGVNVFGGGLALYNAKGDIVGALGISGDTSCADHNFAWRTRHELKLDYVPKGMAKDGSDNIIYDMKVGGSTSGFGHPTCGLKEDDVAEKLPALPTKAAKKD